ncbi:flagellar type III secretion system pore protein FliP [Gemmatimonas sp.]|jgi:flagellar biosynthetic protein FliP|uniref:flagellar type III secretion system pore protein FliP n=1 Tax=Gemmatimonas sp. TaxID=1962908 RepID=UPI0037C16243
MLIASLGVLAALAFVLGLGAVCLWALKRWGMGSLKAKTRVPVEVVQRVPLGPKTGLTVVRVGEKVVALSVGEGGVTTLFELAEDDRQRVIATSQLPVQHASSTEATAAFAPLAPASFASNFGKLLGQNLKKEFGLTTDSGVPAVTVSAVEVPAVHASAVRASVVPLSLTEPAEIPRFLTAPLTTSHGAPVTYAPVVRKAASDTDFRAALNISLSGATRLAALLAFVLVSTAGTLSAQPAPTQPAPTQPAPARPQQAQTQQAQPAQPAAAPLVIDVPKLEITPLVPITTGRPTPQRPTPRLSNAGTIAPNAQPPRAPRPGNGAQLAPQAASARQPMNKVVVDSAQDVPPKAQSATPAPIAADDAIMRMMPQMDVKLGGDGDNGGLRLNGTVGIVIMMGLLTLLPTLLLMMTGFTRILIVLQFLKQAMGTQSAPPGQLLAAMALLLTGFVMGPTLSEMNRTAITPWLDGKMTQVEMMKEGVKPMREFMLKQTREADVKTFVELSRMPRPATVDEVPLHVLMSAFVASELRTAFQIGFAIYLPFIIIDAVVASVLMSMGMFMLPPAMISLPFKLLLFVLVDGWSLTITSLVQSFK